MNEMMLIILDLLHDMKVDINSIFKDNFADAYNLCQNYSLESRKSAIDFLIDKKLVTLNPKYFLELTANGGQTWEHLFKVKWDLFFEFFTFYENGIDELVYFYATNLVTMKKAIELSNGLMNDTMIKHAENWQPIYWKSEFQGYKIKTKNYNLLPNFYELLPNYRSTGIIKNLPYTQIL